MYDINNQKERKKKPCLSVIQLKITLMIVVVFKKKKLSMIILWRNCNFPQRNAWTKDLANKK